MLTDDEREWLREREKRKDGYYCQHCPYYSSYYSDCTISQDFRDSMCRLNSLMWPPTRDDLEFEARVAARLTRYVNMEPWPNLWPECISCKDHREYDDEAFPPCVLKHTRIEVEKEMDNE